MYSIEICVSTASIIVGDDALGVPTLLSAHSCDIRTMFSTL